MKAVTVTESCRTPLDVVEHDPDIDLVWVDLTRINRRPYFADFAKDDLNKARAESNVCQCTINRTSLMTVRDLRINVSGAILRPQN